MNKKLRWDGETLLVFGKLLSGLAGYDLHLNKQVPLAEIFTRRKTRTDNIIPTMVADQMPDLIYFLEDKFGSITRRSNGNRNGKEVFAVFDYPTLLINGRVKACLDGDELIPLLQRPSLMGAVHFVCDMINNGKTVSKYDLFEVQEKITLLSDGDGPGAYVLRLPDAPNNGWIGESGQASERCNNRRPYYVSKIYPTTTKEAAILIQDQILKHFEDNPKRFYRPPGTRGPVIVLDGAPIDIIVDELMKNQPLLRDKFHTSMRISNAKQVIKMPTLVYKILTEHAKMIQGAQP